MKKESKTPAAGTKDAGGASKPKNRGGNEIALLLSAALILASLWTMAFSIRKQYESELDAEYESLANSMYAVRNLINFEDSLQASYESFDLREAQIFTNVAKLYLSYNGVSSETLSDYAYRMGDCSIFYYPNEGDVITSDNAGVFPLLKSQMRMLKTVGELETEDYDYTATRLNDGWLCFQWEDAEDIYSLDFYKIMETCSHDLCVIENGTGEVVVSSSRKPYAFLDESRITFDEKRTAHEIDGIQAGFYKGGTPLSGVYFEKIRLLNRYSVFVYLSQSSVLVDAVQKIGPVYGMMILCFLLVWFSAWRMRGKGKSIQDRSQCLRLGKRRYLNLPVLRHVVPLLLVGVLATTAITIHLPLLNNYTGHNAKMEKNLNSFVNELELSEEEWGKMEEIFRDLVSDRVAMIGDFMEMMGEDFDTDTLEDLVRAMDFVSAVIYDENGVAELSTEGYVGYTLSKNPEDDESVLWNLLTQANVSLMREFSDQSGFFAAARRTDAPGLIYVTLTDSGLRSIKEQTDVRAALLRVNTDTYAKMYASPAAPDTLLWATASSGYVRVISNNLPETVLMNRYSGVQTINGYDYYLNTMSDDNHIIISVEQTRVFTDTVMEILGQVLPQILLISLFILYSACSYPCLGGWLEKESPRSYLSRLFSTEKGVATDEEREMDLAMKEMCGRLLRVLLLALVLLYVFDTLFSAHPAASYLFSHQWQREPGIFSVTTILLSSAFAILAISLLKAMMQLLSAKMDSRAETFGSLVTSIIQFALIVIIAIYSLYQLGVDTSVILTSAGVLSLIIGYGSQSIVSDLVSGIFLILEDQVRIGETIYIDGYRGEVQRIGLRTTTLKYYATVKVVNNSKMVGFYNFSRDRNAVRWEFTFPAEQDMDQVISLIVDNQERFYAACKGNIIKGPFFLSLKKGVVDYTGKSHYTLQFVIICDIKKWNSVRRRSFVEAYRILLENDIRPSAFEMKSLTS